MIQTFQDDLIQAVNRFSNIVLLYSDDVSVWRSLVNSFKSRTFVFAGTESMVGAAAGFALRGKLPLLLMSAKSLTQAYAQIKEMICEPNLNVKILLAGQADVAILPGIPNLRLLKDGIAQGLEEFGPVCFNVEN